MSVAARIVILGLAATTAMAVAPVLHGAEELTGWTLTGKWTITITTDQGQFDTNWDLQQHEDGTLTGDIEGRQSSAPADGGWVKGEEFGFNVTRDFQDRSFEIEYSGTYSNDALEGRLTAGDGQFTASFTGVRATLLGENE
jgi:hypothetical protein